MKEQFDLIQDLLTKSATDPITATDSLTQAIDHLKTLQVSFDTLQSEKAKLQSVNQSLFLRVTGGKTETESEPTKTELERLQESLRERGN